MLIPETARSYQTFLGRKSLSLIMTRSEASMRLMRFALIIFVTMSGPACAMKEADPSTNCDVYSLSQIIAQPLAHAGKTYCGRVYIRRVGKTIRLSRRKGERPSNDTVLLVSLSNLPLPRDIGLIPIRYQIEATVEPQVDCFRPTVDHADADETCSPFTHPIFFQLHSARRVR